MNKKFYRIFLVLVLTVFTTSAQAGSKDTIKLLDLFGDVFDKVKRDYVEEVDDKELVEFAINGMLSSLDPHSSYLNEKDFDEMRRNISRVETDLAQMKANLNAINGAMQQTNKLIKMAAEAELKVTPSVKAKKK